MVRPKISDQEFNKLEGQFVAHENQMKSLSVDEANKAPMKEVEPQTKIAQADIEKSKDIYLKPMKAISSKEKFNEKWRDDYNFAKEYVYFIAENHEVIGETIKLWTKKFAGQPAEYWEVPVNKPVWGPRYLAEQIKGANYHIF